MEYFSDFFDYTEELIMVLCTEHADACLAKIGYALEYRCGSKVASDVQDTAIFSQSFDRCGNLLLENVYLLVEGEWFLA